jgi:molybdate transport system ATP-binding protein
MTLEVEIRHRFAGFALEAAFSAGRGVTALFGPSGAGKTTVVNAIAGLLRPAEGRIAIDGEVVFDGARGLCRPARRRRIGYVFQDARLFPHLDVAANLAFGARRARPPTPAATVSHVVDLLGLGHLLGRRPAGLSGGERQRVALGRALLAAPRLLLLDEPLASLDQARRAEIIPYLERLRDEAQVPIVYVSHALDEVNRLADTLVLLDGGRVAAAGPIGELMARLDLFPLTGRFEAGALIQAKIVAQDEADRLTEIGFPGGRLWVPRIEAEPGASVRLRVRARDVMLALERPEGISANNVLAATIADMRLDPGPYVDVLLDCAGTGLIARITHRSHRRLGLAVGRPVYAVVKTVTVDRRSISARGH